jgi:hypothetical protein
MHASCALYKIHVFQQEKRNTAKLVTDAKKKQIQEKKALCAQKDKEIHDLVAACEDRHSQGESAHMFWSFDIVKLIAISA